MGEMLLAPEREAVKQRAFSYAAQGVSILPSALGDLAGVMGMVALIEEPQM